MPNSPFIIGFTGSFGSGCTTSAKYLSNVLGFQYFSLSDILKSEATNNRLPFDSRENKQASGNELRSRLGRDFAVKKAEEKFAADKIVIECFRNDGEVAYLKSKYPQFCLIALYAPKDIRWLRRKDEYQGNEAHFDIDDKRDQEEDNPFGQQIKKCVGLSDVVISNNKQWATPKQKDEYEFKLANYTSLLEKPNRAPTQLELNMHVAYSISLMSSCIQRQVGAVITTPDYGKILSWGYNEVPVYSKPCHIEYRNCYRAINKVVNLKKIKIHFCPFCGEKITGEDFFSAENIEVIETPSGRKVFCKKCHEDLYRAFSPGKELDLCRSLHAEENAILQNVFVGGGISLRGMTLYSTTFPCFLCAKKIVNSGIKEVVYVEPYPIVEAMRLLRDSNVELKEFEGVKASAFFKVFRERINVLNSEIRPLLC